MKILAFDIWGDWALFKKFYTTASPLTFHFPPITTLKGIVGAILGLSNNPKDNNFYLEILGDYLFGIQIIKPIKTYRMGYNWIETKKAKYMQIMPPEKSRYQTIIETLKDPYYRVYVGSKEESSFWDKLVELIKNHKSIFTPFLGISEHIAEFKYVGLYNVDKIENSLKKFVSISSVVSIDGIDDISDFLKIESGKVYQRDKIPVEMDNNRKVTKYSTVLYEMNGRDLIIKLKKYWQLENGIRIYLFENKMDIPSSR
ncbi:MAG: type I-B CRISPR-associated protein Cas5 [Candidatus Marinimicrobia bacterium]|nr:type I-B CRISPR-associated protein Cas5 [Candidatus Neomarinimicrobiota bacterium]MBO8152306.1 type I-B CRISPR-associated protein Cas5 [Candidatus Neomarinimicrobiota bacterium]